VQVGIFNKI